jgi:hypothetical protein
VNGLIEDELIVLPGALALFPGIGQHTEFIVPFAFERVGDEAIIRIDEHETALGEISLNLGALDRAAAQPVCFFIPCFDLLRTSSANSMAAGVICSAISLPMASSTGGPAIDWQEGSAR